MVMQARAPSPVLWVQNPEPAPPEWEAAYDTGLRPVSLRTPTRINLSEDVIADTGHFLPFTTQIPGFAFSPHGTLVYALLASDFSLHVYRFDQASGNLAEGGASIPMPDGAGFSPALRQ